MKITVHILLLLLFPVTLLAQGVKEYLNKNKIPLICMVTAGMADATVEVLRYDYEAFDRVFSGANPQFWDAKISHINKWKSPGKERFPGSSTIFVCTTDGYHLARMTQNTFILGAIVFKIGERKNWKAYLLDAAALSLAKGLGFNITLNYIYKH